MSVRSFSDDKQVAAVSAGRNRVYERWRWQIFSVTWLAYAGFYLTRKAFAVAKNELKKPEVMGLTLGDMSWIDGANSVAYAAGQFLFGTLGDKLGTRAIILIGMMGSILVSFAMGGNPTSSGLLRCRK